MIVASMTPMIQNVQHLTNIAQAPLYQSGGEATQASMTGSMNIQPRLNPNYGSTQPQMRSSQAYNARMMKNMPHRSIDTRSTYYQSAVDKVTGMAQNGSTSQQYKQVNNLLAGTNLDVSKFYKSLGGATRADTTVPMQIQPRLQKTFSTQTQMGNLQTSNREYNNLTMNNTPQRTNDDHTAYYQPVDATSWASRNGTMQLSNNNQHSSNPTYPRKQTAMGSLQGFKNGCNDE